MGKRRRFSRYRRLPGIYRFGEDKPADPHAEPQRLTLYVPGTALDRAEMQALRLGFQDAQEYCTEVLLRAIEAEHVKEHMADLEAKRGTLEGLHEIAEDAEYLAELSAAATGREPGDAPPVPGPEGRDGHTEVRFLDETEPVKPPRVVTPEVSIPSVSPDPEPDAAAGRAAEVILRHAGQGGEDPYAFLPSLRRGESVPQAEVAELAQALQALERAYRDTRVMDRGLAFALHRLAFESQILQTDAWPGAFDVWTVDMVRSVQEAVERILSGQDIRYAPGPSPADAPPTPPPGGPTLT